MEEQYVSIKLYFNEKNKGQNDIHNINLYYVKITPHTQYKTIPNII